MLAIECLSPHIFIHYEGKLCIKQFLELCMLLTADLERRPLLTAISKYDELIGMCEACMRDVCEKAPESVREANEKRKMLIAVLQRSKELEADALREISSVFL